jgi:hypothetical protein
MSLIFDEYGRPFIILREQQQKARIKGLDAQKANILAARSVSNLLRTSLGPKGEVVNCLHYDQWIINALGTRRDGQDAGQFRWRSYDIQ